MLGIVAAGNLLQGLGPALPVAVHEQGGSPAMVSVIVAGRGLGGVLGALSGTWWLRRLSVRAIVLGGNAAWAALITAAFVPGLLWLGALFAGISFVAGVLNVAGGVYQVRTTPEAMQGRVGGVMGLVGSGSAALGMLGAGLLLDAQGAGPTLLELGGAMTVVTLLAVASGGRAPRTPAIGCGRVRREPLVWVKGRFLRSGAGRMRTPVPGRR